MDQVSAIIDGKKVLGLKREIDEVKNAYACYELISSLSPNNISDLLKAHAIMMGRLIENSGKFRTGGVAVYKGEEVVHMPPPAEQVPSLVARLMDWLKLSDLHPLIKVACSIMSLSLYTRSRTATAKWSIFGRT